MKEFFYERIGEEVCRERLANGLEVCVVPKPGYAKKYAFFSTRYGGMDTRFRLDGKWLDTPAGIAHYLEHKMFDTREGNALQELAKNGAEPNAFTANAMTAYYFDSTEHFEENLRILLSFVSIPYFTDESVAKEQGIIGQEIGMIEDDPDWVVFMDLMQALYEKHPVRVSVAGSAESISHITAETLYACHKAFYDPSNMVLCVAGDVDPEKICQAAREILPERPGAPVARGDYGAQEPAEVCQPMIQREMEVSVPLFQLGFKGEAAPEGEGALRQQLLGELACEALLGNSGPLYARLYREGLVNRNFSYGYESYPGCAFLCAGGESKDPEGVRAAVAAEAERIAREGIDPELWERLKKSSYGNRVRALNSFEHICISQAQSFFQGCDFLRFPEVYDSLTREDAQAMIARWVTPERTALSVVRPREEAVE